MPWVRMVCLANSRKLGGRCVAGWKLDSGGWIRPVSARQHEELVRGDYLLNNGQEPCLLDVIDVEVEGHLPKPHQPENWLIGPSRRRFVRHLSHWTQAAAILNRATGARTPGPDLFGNQARFLSPQDLQRQPPTESLALVRALDIHWVIGRTDTGARQTRCRFLLEGVLYDLPVTDPQLENRLKDRTDGVYLRKEAGIDPLGRVDLTISLGDPWGGYCYKLVAAVIVRP